MQGDVEEKYFSVLRMNLIWILKMNLNHSSWMFEHFFTSFLFSSIKLPTCTFLQCGTQDMQPQMVLKTFYFSQSNFFIKVFLDDSHVIRNIKDAILFTFVVFGEPTRWTTVGMTISNLDSLKLWWVILMSHHKFVLR